MKKNELKIINAPELIGMEKSKAEKISQTFEPMVEMLKGFESQFDKIVKSAKKEITYEVTARAKRLRLDIGQVRIQTDKIRKAEKEEYLRAGKAIDGVSNILKWAVTDRENELKEIESHFERLEEEAKQKLQKAREERLSAYVEDAHERDLVKFEEDEFEALLEAKKKQKEEEVIAIRMAEEQRQRIAKEEEEERQRIREENEKLRKEAEAKEEERKKELAIWEAKLKAEEKLRAKQAREQQEREEKIKLRQTELRLENERLAREQQEILDRKAEELRIEEERKEAEAEAKLNMGDAKKINEVIKILNDAQKFEFKSKKNKQRYEEVKGLIDKVINHLQK